jgi:hypothetical protein
MLDAGAGSAVTRCSNVRDDRNRHGALESSVDRRPAPSAFRCRASKSGDDEAALLVPPGTPGELEVRLAVFTEIGSGERLRGRFATAGSIGDVAVLNTVVCLLGRTSGLSSRLAASSRARNRRKAADASGHRRVRGRRHRGRRVGERVARGRVQTRPEVSLEDLQRWARQLALYKSRGAPRAAAFPQRHGQSVTGCSGAVRAS